MLIGIKTQKVRGASTVLIKNLWTQINNLNIKKYTSYFIYLKKKKMVKRVCISPHCTYNTFKVSISLMTYENIAGGMHTCTLPPYVI